MHPSLRGFAFFTALAVQGATAFAVNTTDNQGLQRITGSYSASVYADGLSEPVGLAVHPLTSEIYVAEKAAGRISVLREGHQVVAVSDGWEVQNDLPAWAVTSDKPLRYWLHNRLREPAGISFSSDGHLFVTEQVADGRLLEFMPDDSGALTKARAIPIPWLYKEFAWESVAVAADGRLFLTGSAAESGPGLFFGVALMRDVRGDWWVIDYGPFAGFCSVGLSREQDILVVGEQVTGTVTWWDTLRHRAIGTVTKSFPDLQCAAVLPDGALAVSEPPTVASDDSSEAPKPSFDGRIYRVNPQSGEADAVVKGLDQVEGMLVDRNSGIIYATEKNTGQVLALKPRFKERADEYLLENTVRISEIAAGLPPKRWPPFLRGFFKDLGINPRDEIVRQGEQGHELGQPNSYTLVEVGKSIPLIAGQVRTQPGFLQQEEDPITDIDFIVLFPNHSFRSAYNSAPGLSFFSARHSSGKINRTYSVENLKAVRFSTLDGWKLVSDNGSIYLPTTACTVRPTETGMDITLAFISMTGDEDYYLQLHCGESNTGQLVVDNRNGSRTQYGVDFTEEVQDGAAYNSIVVAGFSNNEDGKTPGWLNIGNWPLGYSVNPDQDISWTPHSANSQKALQALWGLNEPPAGTNQP